jgi:hypothetical protein
MFQWYRCMRVGALILAALAGIACRRSALQEDGGGTGSVGFDAASPGDAASLEAAGPVDVRLPTEDANCGKVGVTGSVVPPEILIVLDRSVSVDQTRWNDLLSALVAVIGANAASIDWGLYAFPKNGPACGPGTVTTAIDVEVAPGSSAHVIAHLAAAGTGASATPIAAAVETATAYMLSRTSPYPKFLLLVTDGAPTCAGSIDALTADPTRANADAVAAVTAAANAGVRTFVMAPSSTAGSDREALDALAEAGRYPQSPPGPKFATETTAHTWIQPSASGNRCTVSIGINPPPVPDVVTVVLNGVTVPRDRSHMAGWDYADAGMTYIIMYGSACEQLLASRSWSVAVYFGCPGI